MGHRKRHAPRHGSLRFMPRKRAKYIKGRIRNWPEIEGDPRFLGFAGFKAGMTHITYIENKKTSPYYGKELMKPVTILDVPPIVLMGIKVYRRSEYGLRCIGEIWAKQLDPVLKRKIKLPNPEKYDFNKKLSELKKKIDDLCEIRGIFYTQPSKASGVPRKKPDILEIKVSGGVNPKERFDYALKFLGKELRIRDVFKEGDVVDVIGVTKGKGFQGVVKRFGVKILPRKTRGAKRAVGCIGPWHPARVMYTVPRAGQMGFHQRVEYHKEIVKIGENGEEVTPKGGFLHYGIVKGDYVMLMGSVMGPKKRLIRLRHTIRPLLKGVTEAPTITYISRESQQKK